MTRVKPVIFVCYYPLWDSSKARLRLLANVRGTESNAHSACFMIPLSLIISSSSTAVAMLTPVGAVWIAVPKDRLHGAFFEQFRCCPVRGNKLLGASIETSSPRRMGTHSPSGAPERPHRHSLFEGDNVACRFARMMPHSAIMHRGNHCRCTLSSHTLLC